MIPQIGRRYRVNDMAHPWDGRCVRLEIIDGATGFVQLNDDLKRVALSCLSDRGVLQAVPERLATVDHYVRVFDVYQGAGV